MVKTAKCSTREERHRQLRDILEQNPFLTDEELARHFRVSIQTVRLDRMVLNIPELRERVKNLAHGAYGQLKSLSDEELVGELLDLNLGTSAISLLEVKEDMVLEKSKVVRGHHLFAQANSLAAAVVDAEIVFTGSARVRFKRPVYLGEKVVAQAVVKARRGITYLVSVYSRVQSELVFKGQFIMAVPDADTITGRAVE